MSDSDIDDLLRFVKSELDKSVVARDRINPRKAKPPQRTRHAYYRGEIAAYAIINNWAVYRREGKPWPHGVER